MSNIFLLLILLLAIAIGWWLGRREGEHRRSHAELLEAAVGSAGDIAIRDQSPSDLEALAASLRVSPKTVDTHLELGKLCRRRGEAGKAIHIHQRLLESNWLGAPWAARARMELARDYYSAGLLDRAETLLQEITQGGDTELAGKAGSLLLGLYEQERDWEQAIQAANALRRNSGREGKTALAHYHCEIAAEALVSGNHRRVDRKLMQALREDENCARAMMLAAENDRQQGLYDSALGYYRMLAARAPEYLPEVLDVVAECFEAGADEAGLIAFLREVVDADGPFAAVALLAELIRRDGGNPAAAHFIASQLRRRPSLRGLLRLVELNLAEAAEEESTALETLRELVQQMADGKPAYQCGDCGFSGNTLHWHCPRCKGWGVVRPVQGLECLR